MGCGPGGPGWELLYEAALRRGPLSSAGHKKAGPSGARQMCFSGLRQDAVNAHLPFTCRCLRGSPLCWPAPGPAPVAPAVPGPASEWLPSESPTAQEWAPIKGLLGGPEPVTDVPLPRPPTNPRAERGLAAPTAPGRSRCGLCGLRFHLGCSRPSWHLQDPSVHSGGSARLCSPTPAPRSPPAWSLSEAGPSGCCLH